MSTGGPVYSTLPLTFRAVDVTYFNLFCAYILRFRDITGGVA